MDCCHWCVILFGHLKIHNQILLLALEHKNTWSLDFFLNFKNQSCFYFKIITVYLIIFYIFFVFFYYKQVVLQQLFFVSKIYFYKLKVKGIFFYYFFCFFYLLWLFSKLVFVFQKSNFIKFVGLFGLFRSVKHVLIQRLPFDVCS